MLTQFRYQTTADYNKAFHEAVGPDLDGFNKKRDRLFERWCEKQSFPSEASALMRQVLSKQLSPSPVDCALVIDNVDFFRFNYSDLYEQTLENALQIACMCGSKKIAVFLLDTLKTNFIDPKMYYLLEYIMTFDIAWAEEVAHSMMKAGQKEMPEGISAFPTMAEYRKIQGLFISQAIKGETEKKATNEKNEMPLSGKLEIKIEMGTPFSKL